MKAVILTVLSVGFAITSASGEAATPPDTLAETLAKTKVTFKFLQTPAQAALEYLAKQSGVTIDVGDAHLDVEVTLQGRDMPLDRALRWVTYLAGLAYETRGGRVVVDDAERISMTRLRLATFDVRDLVVAPADRHGQDLLASVGLAVASAGTVFDATEPVAVDEDMLVDVIRTSVAAESWDLERRAIECRRATLFVTQTPEVLDAITACLADLRATWNRRVDVAVDVLRISHGLWSQVLPQGAAPGAQILDAAATRTLVERIGSGGDGLERLGSYATSCVVGQSVVLGGLTRRAIVRDFDTEVASGTAAFDPIIDSLLSGHQVTVRPILDPSGTEVILRLEAQTALGRGLDAHTIAFTDAAGAPGQLTIELPNSQVAEALTSLRLPSGGAAVLALADASTGGSESRLVFVIRAAARTAEESR